MSYLVVRHVPKSPVDGGTFGSYLDDPQIEVYSANASSTTLPLGSTTAHQSNLLLVGAPWLPGCMRPRSRRPSRRGHQRAEETMAAACH